MRMPRLTLLVATLVAAPLAAQPRMTPRQLFEPVVLIGSHASVVVGAPEALAAASDSAAVMRALAACRVASLGEDALQRRIVWPDSATRGAHVVFVVVPPAPVASDCDPTVTEGAALLARGIRVTGALAWAPRSDLIGAEVRIGGGPFRADSVQRQPTIMVTASREAGDTRVPMLTAIVLPADAFAPDVHGDLPDVTIGVSRQDDAARDELLTMYAYNVRRVWYQLLPERLARLGDAAAPARAAVARLRGGALTREGERAARLQVADALLAGGDSSAARVVLHDVMHDAPCLTLASASPAFQRVVDDVRPRGVRCTVMPIGRVALASLVPGLGQAVTGRRGAAWKIGGGTVLLGAMSLGLRIAGNSRYDEYVVATDADAAEDAYDNAAELRTTSTGIAGAAAIAWLLGGIDAVRAERAHRADVASQRDPGTRVSVRVAPGAKRGTLQTGVVIAW
jgi:hypothetical protein